MGQDVDAYLFHLNIDLFKELIIMLLNLKVVQLN